MGRFFLFREVNPGETSPVTGVLKRLKYKGQGKSFSSQITTKVRKSG
jgi:hypothetical protein